MLVNEYLTGLIHLKNHFIVELVINGIYILCKHDGEKLLNNYLSKVSRYCF